MRPRQKLKKSSNSNTKKEVFSNPNEKSKGAKDAPPQASVGSKSVVSASNSSVSLVSMASTNHARSLVNSILYISLIVWLQATGVSTNSASLKDLCLEDKKRIAKLVKELARSVSNETLQIM